MDRAAGVRRAGAFLCHCHARALQEEALTKFLVEDKGFNPARVSSGIAKLKKAKGARGADPVPHWAQVCVRRHGVAVPRG